MTGIMNEYVVSKDKSSLIKVIGVGGGGSNAVNYMYEQGIEGVSFVICNTDDQALSRSDVPIKIQLGINTTNGLGAGNIPEVARQAAEESREEVRQMLQADGTRMVFITAGMGGGTGTGAAPVIAQIAKELNILTVGIVTIPFAFEGPQKILQALSGVAEMSKHVDAMLVIHNDKLRTVYPHLKLRNAFAIANDVLSRAARGISDIITFDAHINVDFADVSTTLKDGGVAIMNSGYASGENRIRAAIDDALNSPLLNNNDIHNAEKIILMFYCSEEHDIEMEEIDQVHEFMRQMGYHINVIWGVDFDETLGDQVKVTVIASGKNMKLVPDDLRRADDIADGEEKSVSHQWGETVDPKVQWMNELYSGSLESKRVKETFTTEQFDFDDALLNRIETEPAYKRR